jgi:hypothetical protein
MTRGVGGRGPANIMKHLKGIHFPVTKNGILKHAEHAEGPDTDRVMEALTEIEDREYPSAAEILKQIGRNRIHQNG